MNNTGNILDISYTDSTIIMFGEHKFTRLINIPSEYLLGLNKANCTDHKLLQWVKENNNRLKQKIGRSPIKVKRCYKIAYESEKAAKTHLRRINELNANSKKVMPSRAYECPKCGGWHLTSLEKK